MIELSIKCIRKLTVFIINILHYRAIIEIIRIVNSKKCEYKVAFYKFIKNKNYKDLKLRVYLRVVLIKYMILFNYYILQVSMINK